MSSHRLPDDFHRFLATSGNVIADPGSGGTFDLTACPMFGLATIPSGTRKLPDDMPVGTVFSVYVTSTTATITTAAGVTVATVGSGEIATFTARTSTAWNVSISRGSRLVADEAGSIGVDLNDSGVTTDVVDVSGALNAVFAEAGVKHVDVSLPVLREVATMAVGNITANGGLLASDTTPILGPVNGATAGCQRVQWAASNNDVVMFQVSLPANLDDTLDITLGARIASGGTTNAVGFTVTSYFDETGAAVSDTTGTNQTTTYSTVTATIAAADVPAGARTMTVTLTPVAHTTDTLNLTALWLEVPVTVNGF